METTNELAYEQSRVDAAYLIADGKIEWLNRELTETITAGDNKAADIVKRSYRDRLARLRELTKPGARFLLAGRVDLVPMPDDDLSGRSYYIGLAGLSDGESEDPVVIAWESPLAEAFRDPMSFGGGNRVGRKRIFFGENRELRDLQETVFIDGQPAAGSGDPLLEALKGRVSGELHEIVATIQAEQFRLMEVDADRTLVVQGGPGTGKTIVGLHRVSVLLHRAQGRLVEGDVLVVGPSDIFVRYISNVLPDLGRMSVRHLPVAQVGAFGLRPSRTDQDHVRRIKGREVMAEVIARYLECRITAPEQDLELSAGVAVGKEKVRALVTRIRSDRHTPYNDRRLGLQKALLNDLAERGYQLSPTDPLIENALSRIMPDRSEKRVVQDLLTGPKLLAESAEGLLDAAEQAAIRRPSENIGDADWLVDDLPLLDEASWQLKGRRGIGQRYLHVVVDEAQDLSPMQLRMLARRLHDGGGMTILGDLSQATSPWAPQSWESHLSAGGIRPDVVEELIASYRIPKPLLAFANQLLQVIDVPTQATTSVIDEGDHPRLVECVDSASLTAQAVNIVDALLERGAEPGQVGIIGPEETLHPVANALARASIEHAWAARSLLKRVTLVPHSDAKGLEFDHVLVLEPATLYRSDPITGPRCLFVALTRSRDTLTLLYTSNLPQALLSFERGNEPPSKTTGERRTEASEPNISADEWRWFVVSGERLLEIHVRDGHADVVEVNVAGGAAVAVAGGHALVGDDGIAWALVTTEGRPVATVTTTDRGAAAEEIAEALLG